MQLTRWKKDNVRGNGSASGGGYSAASPTTVVRDLYHSLIFAESGEAHPPASYWEEDGGHVWFLLVRAINRVLQDVELIVAECSALWHWRLYVGRAGCLLTRLQ
ncbi:hypothetical protein L7F22_047790, partial [Adiantum nelumboides]|nr:hypothetical protein [Adiantum nelumboides]